MRRTLNGLALDVEVRVSQQNKVPRLPKRALEHVHLGQSFAEYDTTLQNPSAFVRTPALNAAASFANPHCFFVGRRGTGKTTITRYLDMHSSNVLLIRPEIFSPSSSLLELEAFRDAKQRPFKSLISAFRRSLQDEVLMSWFEERPDQYAISSNLWNEIRQVEELDFDLRALAFIEQLTAPLAGGDDPAWIRAIKQPKFLSKDMASAGIGKTTGYSILLDAIDESWDGSELAVIYLAALMHACVEINSQGEGIRVLMFIRENIFERVRVIDTEFSRLETCVVALDWSEEQLLELVERRLNVPLTAKFPLNGQTWKIFFEDAELSHSMVFNHCQSRPRDVLTYVALALDTAQSHKHEQIMIEDLQDARRRFSDSRLKDLGDEYQENYPQIAMVLSRFYGLGRRWTLTGIESLLQKLLADNQVISACGSWLFSYSSPEQFVRLMYDIGFMGFLTPRRDGDKVVNRIVYRSMGPRDTTPPPVSQSTDIAVHESYWESLDLQDVLVTEFGESEEFRNFGLLTELPGALNFDDYRDRLLELNDNLRNLDTGRDQASRFEDLVGEVLNLCFFRVLFNIEAQSRDVDGTIRRDWIASNRGESGFWEMVRHRYGATQVLVECKNYVDLKASDFHQANYYMSEQAGRFVIIAFRGDIKNHYYDHVKRVSAQNDGLVLLLNDKDLRVFVRQAINGKVKDSHLMDKYDKAVRTIS